MCFAVGTNTVPRTNAMVIGTVGCSMSVKGGVCSQMLALLLWSGHEDFLEEELS